MHQQIHLYAEKCRLCLKELNEKNSISLFVETSFNDVSLIAKIMVCISLTVQPKDSFPNRICLICKDRINEFYTFRESCHNVYRTLLQSQNYAYLRCIDQTENHSLKVTLKNSKIQILQESDKNHKDPEMSLSETEGTFHSIEHSDAKYIRKESNIDSQSCLNNSPKVSPYCNRRNDKTANENNTMEHLNPEFQKVQFSETVPIETKGTPKLISDLNMEQEIPEHRTVCIDTSNEYIKEAFNEKEEEIDYSVTKEDNDQEKSHKVCLQNIASDEIAQIEDKLNEKEMFEDTTSSETYSNDCTAEDCYQVQEIQEDVICGDYLEQQFRYKCLKCEQFFPDFQAVSSHYVECYNDNNKNHNNEETERSIDTAIEESTKSVEDVFKRDVKEESIPSTELKALIVINSELKGNDTGSAMEKTKKMQHRKTQQRQLQGSHFCSLCKNSFATATILKRHSAVHTGEKPFHCEICNKRFSQVGQLNFHRNFHVNPRYRCKLCNKPFLRPSDIEKHMRTHTGEKPYNCKECSKSFAQSAALQQHERIHTGLKPYSCEICGKKFSQKTNKSKHVKIHKEGAKPHTCEICGRSFSEIIEMELHKAGHGGGKPRKCDYCEKSFRKISELTHHIRKTHTFEKPHKCAFCAKAFYSLYNLKQHVMVHTGQKPYACSKCDMRFTQKGNLTKHFDRKHPECTVNKKEYIVISEEACETEEMLVIESNDLGEKIEEHLVVEHEETVEIRESEGLKSFNGGVQFLDIS